MFQETHSHMGAQIWLGEQGGCWVSSPSTQSKAGGSPCCWDKGNMG